MEYVVTKRYKKKCLAGDVNLPYGTVCPCLAGFIYLQGETPLPMCRTTSQDAYDYFSRNDDGRGKERGELVQKITGLLRTPARENPKAYAAHDERWARVWAAEDELGKFRRPEHQEHWLWNFDFYNAEIADLERIYNIVKGA